MFYIINSDNIIRFKELSDIKQVATEDNIIVAFPYYEYDSFRNWIKKKDEAIESLKLKEIQRLENDIENYQAIIDNLKKEIDTLKIDLKKDKSKT